MGPALLLAAAACRQAPAPPDPRTLAWPEVVAAARGTTVTWRMWRGDPAINAYVDRWVAPHLRDRFGIRLRAVEGQGPEIVNQLVVEREAGAAGSADLVWINGETFHQLRAERLLFGPWAEGLPSFARVDTTSPIVARDFGRDPAGWESPWGRVQFALIYDAARTPDPPRTVAALGEWICDHPGRFTHDREFTGLAFLKILLYSLNGGVDTFRGGLDEPLYEKTSRRVWTWLNERQPCFWREGTAYPSGVAELHRLFANGEVDFSMSYNENEAASKVRQGILPGSTRALLLRDGTLANAHFVAIPFNAGNVAGAMVVADFLLSPEAQLEKARPDVWGDGTVLDVERLPEPWRTRFAELPRDPRTPPADSLTRYAVPELDPRYHERLARDWREHVLRGRE